MSLSASETSLTESSLSNSSLLSAESLQQRIRKWLSRRRIAISLLVFTSLAAINIFVFKSIPFNPLSIHEPWVLLADLAIVLGLFIRCWSAGTLNKSREVTTHGPYAVVRNPLYVGSFLLALGFCMLTKDVLTALLVVGPMSYLYWNQVRHEECRLAGMFPAQWGEYIQAVPRFIPKRWCPDMFRGWTWEFWWLNREYQALLASVVGLVAVYAWHQLTH